VLAKANDGYCRATQSWMAQELRVQKRRITLPA